MPSWRGHVYRKTHDPPRDRPLSKASLATAITAACLGLPLLAPQAASAATQSATFNPVLIVDGGSSSTGFTFSGFTGPVSGVTTTINLTKCDDPIDRTTGACLGGEYSYNEEIQLQLQSPTGTIVSLVPFYGALTGQTPGDTVTWTFADSASSVVSGNTLVSGTYLPFSPLSAFIGENGNGTWNLLFDDGAGGDPLSINNWSLTVNQQVPGPLPVLGAASAFGISRRLRRRIASSRAQA